MSTNTQTINLMVVGCGPHCKRIYLPLLRQYQEGYGLRLACVVDVVDKASDVREHLERNGFDSCEYIFVERSFGTDFTLTPDVMQRLNSVVARNQIQAVIVSTDPLSHLAYVLWALGNDLHILLDKPITSRTNASVDVAQAERILSDYDLVARMYQEKLASNPSLIFSCMAQRRFHPAMKTIRDLLTDVTKDTHCPITSIVMQHSDGQWRFPREIALEPYHGFNEGYGKCSHSGYHFFDMISWFLGATETSEKKLDEVRTHSQFVRPSDFITQINQQDYRNLFGTEYDLYESAHPTYSLASFDTMGEIDANISLTFLSAGKKLTMASVSLLHNAFSRRAWCRPNEDLYKKNGRVRLESYSIQQGPFQCIQYHSYQSNEIAPDSEIATNHPGGEYHSEVFVFRNAGMLGSTAFERIDFGRDFVSSLSGYSRGHQEEARGQCFIEFISAIQHHKSPQSLQSSILDHRRATVLMATAYLSAAYEFNGYANIVARKPFTHQDSSKKLPFSITDVSLTVPAGN